MMNIDEAIDLIGDVISSGAKTGFDEDYVRDAWWTILDNMKENYNE